MEHDLEVRSAKTCSTVQHSVVNKCGRTLNKTISSLFLSSKCLQSNDVSNLQYTVCRVFITRVNTTTTTHAVEQAGGKRTLDL